MSTNQSHFAVFSATVHAIAAHRRRTGQWPNLTADDESERRLAQELSNLRQGVKGQGGHKVTPQRRSYLNQVLGPGWQRSQGRGQDVAAFCADVDAIAAHRDRTGRWPSSTSVDEGERRLAHKLSNIRRGTKGQSRHKVTPQRRAYLDRVLGAGWESSGQGRVQDFAAFCATVDAIAAHRDRTGQWPSSTSVDEGERRLAKRLAKIRQGAKGIRGSIKVTAEGRAYLDQTLGAGWEGRSNDFAAFCATVEAIAAHRDRTGRWPSWTAEDEDERRLAHKLSHIRQGAKGRRGIRITPQRRAYLDQTLGAGWEGRSTGVVGVDVGSESASAGG